MKPRRLHSATTLSMVTTSSGTRPGSLGAVVPGDRLAVGGVLAEPGVEVGGAHDLVLGPVHRDRLVVDVDRRDEPGREEDRLAEDRRSRVDQQVGAVDARDHVLHLADAAVHPLDGHPVEVRAVRAHVVAEVPEVAHAALDTPDRAPRRTYAPAPMPIYEFRCENGHLFEVMQKITDAPVTQCEECGAPVARVFHPIAVHFKGSGFYNTDYGTAKRKRELDKSASDGADKHDAKQGEKKADASKSSDSKPASSSSSTKPASSSDS